MTDVILKQVLKFGLLRMQRCSRTKTTSQACWWRRTYTVLSVSMLSYQGNYWEVSPQLNLLKSNITWLVTWIIVFTRLGGSFRVNFLKRLKPFVKTCVSTSNDDLLSGFYGWSTSRAINFAGYSSQLFIGRRRQQLFKGCSNQLVAVSARRNRFCNPACRNNVDINAQWWQKAYDWLTTAIVLWYKVNILHRISSAQIL